MCTFPHIIKSIAHRKLLIWTPSYTVDDYESIPQTDTHAYIHTVDIFLTGSVTYQYGCFVCVGNWLWVRQIKGRYPSLFPAHCQISRSTNPHRLVSHMPQNCGPCLRRFKCLTRLKSLTYTPCYTVNSYESIPQLIDTGLLIP